MGRRHPEWILLVSRLAAWDLSHESLGRIAAGGLDLAGQQLSPLTFVQLASGAFGYVIEVARADATEKIVPLAQGEAKLPIRVG